MTDQFRTTLMQFVDSHQQQIQAFITYLFQFACIIIPLLNLYSLIIVIYKLRAILLRILKIAIYIIVVICAWNLLNFAYPKWMEHPFAKQACFVIDLVKQYFLQQSYYFSQATEKFANQLFKSNESTHADITAMSNQSNREL